MVFVNIPVVVILLGAGLVIFYGFRIANRSSVSADPGNPFLYYTVPKIKFVIGIIVIMIGIILRFIL